jgi:hypothetical protein
MRHMQTGTMEYGIDKHWQMNTASLEDDSYPGYQTVTRCNSHLFGQLIIQSLH